MAWGCLFESALATQVCEGNGMRQYTLRTMYGSSAVVIAVSLEDAIKIMGWEGLNVTSYSPGHDIKAFLVSRHDSMVEYMPQDVFCGAV